MIDSKTTMQAYQLRKGGTLARMSILRMIAADSVNNRNKQTRLTPGDWRGARHTTLKGFREYYGCFSSGVNQWYSHTGPEFRNEQDSSEINRRLPRGWYTDAYADEMAIGIVAQLPHGRLIAGYRWTSNDERVYFPEIFDDPADAARAADGHAEQFAESAREHSERFNAADALQSKIDTNLQRLRECVALRHRRCMEYVRDEISELIESIRNDRETLATEYRGVL